jgi:hypothetical protein
VRQEFLNLGALKLHTENKPIREEAVTYNTVQHNSDMANVVGVQNAKGASE